MGRPILTVFVKEWREMLRDHRVLFGVFLGPLLLTLAISYLLGATMKRVTQTARTEVIPIAAVGAERGSALLRPLEQSRRFRVEAVPGAEEAERLLRGGRVRVALEFREDLTAALQSEAPAPVRLIYDPADRSSEIALRVLEEVIERTNQELARRRLETRGLDPDLLLPFRPTVSKLPGRSGSIAITLIPYLLMIWSLVGGATIAADLVAGEKERGTMETLLTTPIGRGQIVAGKFAALLSQSWVGLLAMATGLGIGWSLIPAEARAILGAGVQITPVSLGIMLLAMLPYTVFAMALLFGLATWSRNPREAQGYLGMVMFVLMVPIMLGQFMSFFEFSRAWWLALIPILNVTRVMNDALTLRFDPGFFALTLGSMGALSGGALWLSARLFRAESVLFRV
ncbi:MAG: ABC transporter permease [Armatimonadota bacterium]